MSEQERGAERRWTDQEFASCWERSRAGLLGLCARDMHGHMADAEDTLGNAALAALRSAREAEAPRSPPAWLSHIVRHACVDMHRARRRHAGLHVELRDGEPGPEPLSRPGTDPESLLLGRETALQVRDAVASLPPHLSKPFLLRVEEQASYADIAALLGDSAANLRKRVQIARQLVFEALERDERPRSGPGLAGPLLVAQEAAPARIARRFHPVAVVDGAGVSRRAWLLVDSALPAFTQGRREQLVRYVEAHPAGWRKCIELADMLLGAGMLDAAARYYRRALAHRGRERAAWLRLGLALEAQGLAREAAEAFQCGEPCAASEGERLHLRALGARAAGRNEEAMTWLRRAAGEDPREPGHATTLAALLLSLGRPAEAHDAIDMALRADPGDPAALLLGHDAARASGRPREAIARLSLALEAGPCVGSLLRLAGHRIRGRLTSVGPADPIAQLERIAPHLAEVHACRAAALAVNGQPRGALRALQRFVEAHPLDAAGWLHLARGARRIGALSDAAAAVARTLELDPDNPDAHREALRLAAVQRDPQCLPMAREALRRFPDHHWIAAAAAQALHAAGEQAPPGGPLFTWPSSLAGRQAAAQAAGALQTGCPKGRRPP